MMDFLDLKTSLNECEEKVGALNKVIDIKKLKEEIDLLEEKLNNPSFWQNSSESSGIIKNIKILKDKAVKYDEIKALFDNLSLIYELKDESLIIEAEANLVKFNESYEELNTSLLLSNSYDSLNAIVELHPGAGGTEALDWVNMLFRMYQRFASINNFKFTILDYLAGDVSGIKQVTFLVEGPFAYGLLKSENGVHRLIRISPFDASKRRHTTFASVSVAPEVDENINIEIDNNDLKIDTFRSSGNGGQSVNTTDSAVRITHLPTKIVVSCQNERSQIQNREQAIKILKSKLYQLEVIKNQKELHDVVGEKLDNSFGSQIRTYTFHPYTLVKDHRTNFETGNGAKVLDGEIMPFINAYLRWLNN